MQARTAGLAISSCAVLALSVASVEAGPCAGEIDRLAKAIVASDAGAGPTAGKPAPSEQVKEETGSVAGLHPPTGGLTQATEGRATSPQDVQRQTAGQPTAGEQAAGQPPTRTIDRAAARTALENARQLDLQGKEVECMDAVRQAKQLAGEP